MNDDAKDANDTFPFYPDYTDSDSDITIGVNMTYSTGYGYHYTPTLETIDGKIESMKVSIKNLESRISVIEQNMLRLITRIEEVLDKVKKNGKV